MVQYGTVHVIVGLRGDPSRYRLIPVGPRFDYNPFPAKECGDGPDFSLGSSKVIKKGPQTAKTSLFIILFQGFGNQEWNVHRTRSI